jgi:hypothetical protein
MSRIPRVTGSDPGLLHKILRDCQLKVENLERLL